MATPKNNADAKRLLDFVRKQESKGKQSIAAFQRQLALDVVDKIQAEKDETAEMAEKALMRLMNPHKP